MREESEKLLLPVKASPLIWMMREAASYSCSEHIPPSLLFSHHNFAYDVVDFVPLSFAFRISVRL